MSRQEGWPSQAERRDASYVSAEQRTVGEQETLSAALRRQSNAVRRPSRPVMGTSGVLRAACVRLRVVPDDRPAAHRAAPAAARESSAEEPAVLPDDKPAAQAGARSAGEMDPEWMQSSAVRLEA